MTDLLEAAVRLGREQPEENLDTAETSNFSQQDRVALGDCTWEGGETSSSHCPSDLRCLPEATAMWLQFAFHERPE